MSRPDGVVLHPVTIDNVEKVLAFRGEAQVARFRTYLSQRRVGVFVLAQDQVVGHAWGTRATSHVVTNGYFSLGPGDALISDCQVDACYRGRGIYPFMIQALSRQLQTAGANHVLIDTARTNVASIRGIEKAGFDLVAETWFFMVGGRRVARWQRSRR